MRSKLAIITIFSGWILFVFWLLYDYLEYQNRAIIHIFQPMKDYESTSFHVLIILVPFLYTIIGYLINERAKLLNSLRKSEARYRELSLVDELTKIYNRRGFNFLADQQLKIVSRTKQKLLLLFIDVDNVKGINDKFGHGEGDNALIATANILKKHIRKSDIIARLGGDEFVALIVEKTPDLIDVLAKRIDEHCQLYNIEKPKPFKLSLSIGFARYDPLSPCSIEEILDRADKNMYEKRQIKKNYSETVDDRLTVSKGLNT